jgi:hypothetical protein
MAAATTALLGLQDVTQVNLERRRRAVRRGRDLLDGLDELRLALLDGAVPLPALQQVRTQLAEKVEVDADPGLCRVLEAIEVRCAVELAKLEAAARSTEAPLAHDVAGQAWGETAPRRLSNLPSRDRGAGSVGHHRTTAGEEYGPGA